MPPPPPFLCWYSSQWFPNGDTFIHRLAYTRSNKYFPTCQERLQAMSGASSRGIGEETTSSRRDIFVTQAGCIMTSWHHPIVPPLGLSVWIGAAGLANCRPGADMSAVVPILLFWPIKPITGKIQYPPGCAQVQYRPCTYNRRQSIYI